MTFFVQAATNFTPVIAKESAKRFFTTQSTAISKKVLVITGGLAQMGPGFAKAAMTRGYDVVSCSRRVLNTQAKSEVKWVKINDNELIIPQFWENLLVEYCSDYNKIAVVNTIGAAIAPEGTTLEDINEKPVLTALAALRKQSNETGQKVAIGNVSSVCATYFPRDPAQQKDFCEQSIQYCSTRQRVDQELEISDIPSTTVRPGFIFTDLRAGNIIDSGHAYSPEQFAALPLQPIAGSGDQVQQPVYMDDIIEAVLNGLETNENHLVDAVGPDSMTQKEMFKFFTDLVGTKFRPLQVPYDLAAVIAKHAPKGRIAPYSINMFRHLELAEHKTPLCKKKFEALVGRPLTSMSQLYSNCEGAKFVLPKPPIIEHTKEILQVLWNIPEAREDFSAMLAKYGRPMCVRVIKALLS